VLALVESEWVVLLPELQEVWGTRAPAMIIATGRNFKVFFNMISILRYGID
jgi:hypothetical protein